MNKLWKTKQNLLPQRVFEISTTDFDNYAASIFLLMNLQKLCW